MRSSLAHALPSRVVQHDRIAQQVDDKVDNGSNLALDTTINALGSFGRDKALEHRVTRRTATLWSDVRRLV